MFTKILDDIIARFIGTKHERDIKKIAAAHRGHQRARIRNEGAER